MPSKEHLDFVEMTPLELAELRRWGRTHARPARYLGSAENLHSALAELRGQGWDVAPTETAPTVNERPRPVETAMTREERNLLLVAGGAALAAGALWLWWRRERSSPPTPVMGVHSLGLDVLGQGY